MEKSLIFFLILFFTFLILSIFLRFSLNKFNSNFKASLSENEKRINDLYKFAYDIHFNPPPSVIDINNPYECTPTNLRKCNVNDPFSCAGCKSLISTCTNISSDLKYIDINGVETIIPKNDTEDEGYCLTRKNANQKCNPFHGDLVLVQTDPDSVESMLYCQCKNPGYIGSTQIDGACNEVFVCNGKIDDINKPLDEIQCDCDNGLVPNNVNSIPTCMVPLVKEYDKYDDDFYENIETVPKDRFINEIQSFPGDKILNPCKYCLFTGAYVPNGNMVPTEDGGWQCVLNDSRARGIPFRRDLKRRILKGSKGPDSVIDVAIWQVYVHGYIYDSEFEQITITFLTDGNREIAKYLNMNTNEQMGFINMRDHQLVFPGSFGKIFVNNFPGVYCDGSEGPTFFDDFAYDCYFTNYIPLDRRPSHYGSYVTIYSSDPEMKFDTAPNCPPKKHSSITNAEFKNWKHFEGYNSAHSKEIVNNLVHLKISEAFKQSEPIRYIFSMYNFPQKMSKHLSATWLDDYKKWFATLIPK
ncbi:PIF-1 [Callinectes sapidus nudivirus]|nr:PIF-1 [Callinectes sapidus nudivirus]